MFGPTNREVGNPSWMSGAFELGGITITYNRLWIICFTLAVFVALLGDAALHALRPRNARGDAEPRRWRPRWASAPPRRCADLRPRLRHRRHRRRGAVADRQCQPQSRPGLHHRQLHGRGVRRRRQSVGHAGRRLRARHRQQVPRAAMPAPCSARSRSWCCIILFIQKRPRGLFALKGRAVEA